MAQFLQDAGEIVSTDHPVDADAAELARAGEGGLLDQLVPLLADADVHAVFDHRVQTIVGAHRSQRPGIIGEAAGTRHREAELGAGLIARLPAFPQIPLDEIKDIKAELHGPLARYRSRVAALQAGMKQDIASPETAAPTGMALQATAQAVLARARAWSELRKSDYFYLFQLQRAGERSRHP